MVDDCEDVVVESSVDEIEINEDVNAVDEVERLEEDVVDEVVDEMGTVETVEETESCKLVEDVLTSLSA